MPAAKALVQVEFPVYALRTQNSCEEEKLKNCKVQNAVMLSKNYFLGIKYVHANVQCLCIVYTNFKNIPEINVRGVEFLIQALSFTPIFLLKMYILSILMLMQNLMNFHR